MKYSSVFLKYRNNWRKKNWRMVRNFRSPIFSHARHSYQMGFNKTENKLKVTCCTILASLAWPDRYFSRRGLIIASSINASCTGIILDAITPLRENSGLAPRDHIWRSSSRDASAGRAGSGQPGTTINRV